MNETDDDSKKTSTHTEMAVALTIHVAPAPPTTMIMIPAIKITTGNIETPVMTLMTTGIKIIAAVHHHYRLNAIVTVTTAMIVTPPGRKEKETKDETVMIALRICVVVAVEMSIATKEGAIVVTIIMIDGLKM